MNKKAKRRLLPRFGLKWLLVLALFASFFFGWFSRCYHRAKRESQLLEELVFFGPKVTFSYEDGEPPGPKFLREYFGYVKSVSVTSFPSEQVTKESFVGKIVGFRELKKLSMHFCKDLDLSPITKLEMIEELDLAGNEFEDYSCLKKLPKLKKLSIGHPYVQIEDWTWLGAIESLEELDLSSSRIDELPKLNRLQNLKVLDLTNCSRLVSTEPVVHLQNLEKLSLGKGTPMQILDEIERLPNLKILDLCPHRHEPISNLRIEEIKNRIPGVKVSYGD